MSEATLFRGISAARAGSESANLVQGLIPCLCIAIEYHKAKRLLIGTDVTFLYELMFAKA